MQEPEDEKKNHAKPPTPLLIFLTCLVAYVPVFALSLSFEILFSNGFGYFIFICNLSFMIATFAGCFWLLNKKGCRWTTSVEFPQIWEHAGDALEEIGYSDIAEYIFSALLVISVVLFLPCLFFAYWNHLVEKAWAIYLTGLASLFYVLQLAPRTIITLVFKIESSKK